MPSFFNFSSRNSLSVSNPASALSCVILSLSNIFSWILHAVSSVKDKAIAIPYFPWECLSFPAMP